MNCLSSCERESNLLSFIRLCFMAAGIGVIAPERRRPGFRSVQR
jgi:hypothetical protein